MQLDISTIMMIFFILALSASIWKIYVFLPNKPLEDDDRTQEADDELHKIMLKVLNKNASDISTTELFLAMKEDEDFDAKRFWRFNQNRLNLLRKSYNKD